MSILKNLLMSLKGTISIVPYCTNLWYIFAKYLNVGAKKYFHFQGTQIMLL